MAKTMAGIMKPWLPLLVFLSLSFLASASLSVGYGNQQRYVIVDQCLALCEEESDMLRYRSCERNCTKQLSPPEEQRHEQAAGTERRRQEEIEREREKGKEEEKWREKEEKRPQPQLDPEERQRQEKERGDTDLHPYVSRKLGPF